MNREPLLMETDTTRSSEQRDRECFGKGVPRATRGLLIALALFGAAISIDLFVIGRSIRAEGEPNFEWPYLVKTFLIGLGSLQCLWALLTMEPKTQSTRETPRWHLGHANWGSVPLSWLEPDTGKSFGLTAQKGLIYSVLTLSGLFLILFLYSPALFHALGREDYPIEWASAVLSLVSCGIMGYVSALFYQSSLQQKYVYLLGTLALAFTFFLIAMEEISWFQRVFSIETPEAFSKNYQGELNFHNFFTNFAEVLYYFGSFSFCIALPFVKEHTSLSKHFPACSFLIPSRFILFISTLFVAYNYDMWNIIFTQVSFFITIFILAYYSLAGWKPGEPWFIPSLLLGFVATTQLIFLLAGHHFIKGWDVTEYKEFFIPLSFLFYSVEILFKSTHLCVANSR